MNSYRFDQARQYALHRLESELSPDLLYHGFVHTHDEVVPSAQRLAGLEGVNGEALELLLTAAWMHDIGYIEQSKNHEIISARIAAEVLPGFGYSPVQIEIIRGSILATVIPQTPTTILESIMGDADLSVLGSDKFLARNTDLRRELAFFGQIFSDVEWFTGQVNFMQAHRFHTTSAQSLLDEQKSVNILELNQKLIALTP